MLVVATADFHGRALPEIPPCDLLVYAGDIGGEQFAFGPFSRWLSAAPARHKVGVAGNHDGWADGEDNPARRLPWTYLHNEAVVIDGLSIWGSPYSNKFFNWAHMADENGLARIFSAIPETTDLVVTHGPPYGVCDRVVRPPRHGDPSVGSHSLRERLVALPTVRWLVCGHIHEAYGSGKITRPDGSHIDVYNVSVVNESYRVVNRPVVVEM